VQCQSNGNNKTPFISVIKLLRIQLQVT